MVGERRWRAAGIAGIEGSSGNLKEYDNKESMEIAIVENLQREDLNPIEEAEAYRRLIDEFGLKQDEAAQKVSKARTAVTELSVFWNWTSGYRKMVIDDMISGGHARALLAIEDKEEQYGMAMTVFVIRWVFVKRKS